MTARKATVCWNTGVHSFTETSNEDTVDQEEAHYETNESNFSSLPTMAYDVRLFLSEDSPSQVGLGAQDNLQVKASWLLHSSGVGFEDQLPPGFEGAQSTNHPSVSSELEDSHNEDHQITLIPITPIEDEDVAQPSSDSIRTNNSPINSQLQSLPQSLVQGFTQKPQRNILTAPKPLSSNEKSSAGLVQPDVVAAASAALTAFMRSNEQGSLIDQELLIKILSNPEMIKNLVTDYGPAANVQSVQMPSTSSLNLSVTQPGIPPGYINRVEPNIPLSVPPTSGLFHPVTNAVTSMRHALPSPGIAHITAPAVKPPPVKDMNYYKSLIQQHGGEKPEAHDRTPQFVNHHHMGTKTETLQSSKLREPKTKNKKHCLYFNSSRGCKNGANCAFQHDMSVQQRIGSVQEAQSAKRMKVDRQLTGRI
ncbi:hypothetical protein IFM89_032432 [Coptis chinensis]|uniref:C3H1-type domain-containing protein n=1 Tax=Coptis chinensis TaxID=261450 RepID=A0A835I7B2_9MAGN|nr:hypothetical protein IFM89_032432 [Coptis chinensis]